MGFWFHLEGITKISSVCYVIPCTSLKRQISSGRDAASTSEFTFLPQKMEGPDSSEALLSISQTTGHNPEGIALTNFEFISKLPLSLKIFPC